MLARCGRGHQLARLSGRTALHAAVVGRSSACVSLLLVREPDVKNGVKHGEKQSALHTAVRVRDVGIVRLVVRALPSLRDQTNGYGRTPPQEREHILEGHNEFSRFMRDNKSRIP